MHETSGGNPFYALELARALGTNVDPTQPLQVPETLEGLVRARLDELPSATRESLLLAAAVGRPSTELLARLGVTERVLDRALAARVIERTDGAIRFTHPLLASVVYHDVSADERRRAHGRLAHFVADPLDRARHLALSTESQDPEIAAVLEDAAALAVTRAPIAAAELAEHALRLTPAGADSDRHRRALAAARVQRSAGEWPRARTILHELLADERAGSWRAEALVLLAELESVARSIPLLEAALREAASRPALQSAIHCRLAWATRFGPPSEHSRTALELAEQLDDDVLRRQAHAVQAVLGWFAGEAEASEGLPARARDFPTAVGGDQLVREATLAVANTLAPIAKRDEARALFEHDYREWEERDEPRSSRALWGLAWVEFWSGRWALGAEYAARARDISVQYGLEVPQDHLPIAVIAVHRGELELAREHSERAFELADEQFGLRPPQHLAVIGLVARWSGDRFEAVEWLGKAEQQAAAFRWNEPSVRWWSGDLIELLLELGRVEDAIRVLDVWEADATRVTRESVSAHVTRCRGLVASAKETSLAPVPCSTGRLRSTTRSETPSAAPGHCSGLASSGGERERSETPARRSRLRSTVSNSSGLRRGSRRPATSLGASAGARAKRG